MWIRSFVCPTLLSLYCLFVQVKSKTNECISKKLDGCSCSKDVYQQEVLLTVRCEGLGFVNTVMLQELPEKTGRLIFTGNHIPVLENNLFGDRALNSLKVIDMTNNGIREIKGQAFHHVLNVEMLILDHNNISISNQNKLKNHHSRVFSNFYNLKELHLTNAFADNTDEALAADLHDIFVSSNLTKLYKLHLEQNEIRKFNDSNVFCDLLELHDLHLGDNNIPYLNFNINCIKKLRYLDLEGNNITRFSQGDLDAFDRLTQPFRSENLILEIKNNPFRCDSAIKNLYLWLQKTKVEVRDKEHLECHQAKYGRKYIMNMKNFAETKQARFSQALMVLLVILVLILVTLLVAYFYLKKDAVRKKLGPMFDNVTRKVHYTTIESQDV